MKHYSTQPRKQRLAGYNKNAQERTRAMAAHLSDELLKEYSRVRSVTVRKGDTVKVIRGAFKGQVSKVVKVFPRKGMISVEEATLTKADGKKVARLFRPSKVILTKLDLSDPWRREKLNRFKVPTRAEKKEDARGEKKAARKEEEEHIEAADETEKENEKEKAASEEKKADKADKNAEDKPEKTAVEKDDKSVPDKKPEHKPAHTEAPKAGHEEAPKHEHSAPHPQSHSKEGTK